MCVSVSTQTDATRRFMVLHYATPPLPMRGKARGLHYPTPLKPLPSWGEEELDSKASENPHVASV